MEQLKLVLVDDEPIILKGLLETYDWEKMGYQVVGAARNGEEALQMILDKVPDLVLTDVRMKKMSGLALIEKAKELNLNTNFIMVSAYKDFDYAKKACENGALSYLVKPIDDTELENTMCQIYEICTEKKHKDKNYELWERTLVEDRENFLNQMVGKYLDGSLDKKELTDFFTSLAREKDLGNNYIAIAAGIDIAQRVVNQNEFDLKQYLLDSILYKRLKEHYLVWTKKTPDGITCYLVDIGEKNNIEPFKLLLTNVRNEIKSNLISAISNADKGIEGMKQSYIQALHLFEIASEAGAGILTVNQNTRIKVKPQYSLDIESQILGAIRRNNQEQLKEVYKKFIYLLPTDENSIKIYLRRLAVRIEFTLDIYGLTQEMILGFQNFHQVVDDVMVVKLIDVLYQLLISIIEQRKRATCISNEDYFKDYVKLAVEYIQDHLQDETLSIKEVSERVFLNPVYFGRLFKNLMKIPFKKYVQNLRMEKAKELLMEGQESIANIGIKVGIPNPSYFTQLFKRYTGMLPSEYTRSLAND